MMFEEEPKYLSLITFILQKSNPKEVKYQYKSSQAVIKIKNRRKDTSQKINLRQKRGRLRFLFQDICFIEELQKSTINQLWPKIKRQIEECNYKREYSDLLFVNRSRSAIIYEPSHYEDRDVIDTSKRLSEVFKNQADSIVIQICPKRINLQIKFEIRNLIDEREKTDELIKAGTEMMRDHFAKNMGNQVVELKNIPANFYFSRILDDKTSYQKYKAQYYAFDKAYFVNFQQEYTEISGSFIKHRYEVQNIQNAQSSYQMDLNRSYRINHFQLMHLTADFDKTVKLLVVFKIERNIDQHFREVWKDQRKAYQNLLDYIAIDRNQILSKGWDVISKL